MRPMRVANVCFHGIGAPDRELEPGEGAYWIGTEVFLEVLDLLADRPDVRLSFDDGNASDVEIALPALVERGLSATFYVVAGRLDRRGSLGRDDVRHLHAAGMTIGTHGMWHRPWRHLDAGQLDEELIEARAELGEVIGARVQDAALPLGQYDRRVLSRLRSLDYRSVQTSDRRAARPGGWLQPRYSIGSGDSARSVDREVLRRPPLRRQARAVAVGTFKRLR